MVKRVHPSLATQAASAPDALVIPPLGQPLQIEIQDLPFCGWNPVGSSVTTSVTCLPGLMIGGSSFSPCPGTGEGVRLHASRLPLFGIISRSCLHLTADLTDHVTDFLTVMTDRPDRVNDHH